MLGSPAEFNPDADASIFADVVDCGRLHFAMSPLWAANQEHSYIQTFGREDFPKWFANLTLYIAAQIAYPVAKTPAATKEFTTD